MKTESETTDTAFYIRTRLDSVQIDPDLFVVKRTDSLINSDSRGPFQIASPFPAKETTTQGFLTKAAFANLKKGGDARFARLDVAPQSSLDAMRRGGFWESEKWDLSSTPFDDIAADPSAVDRIVRVDAGSHMVFDRFGVPLPVALYFDYMKGRIRDGQYDLEKLAAHLLTRDDVTIFPRDKGWRGDACDRKRKATKVEECVLDVPHYNISKGCHRTVAFVWHPRREDYIRVWDACLASGDKYPSTRLHEAVFSLDILGARACGAALHDDFNHYIPEDESDD